MIKAVAYARYSSDNQREESIDAQLRAIRAYCEKNEIEIVKEYVDEAQSARSDRRVAFLRMFDELSTLGADVVIVHKYDRFSRDRYDYAYYKREIKKLRMRLVSVLEPIDDTPESVLMESLITGMAEFYSRNLGREVMKGLNENALKALHNGGTPPLGYDVGPDRHYVINEREADVVRKIFKLYAGGQGYGAILDALKNERTKTGGTFGKNSLHDLLRNEKYIGVYTFNRAVTNIDGSRNNHASKPNDQIVRVPGGIPRIIDDTTWAIVRERMDGNKHNAAGRAKRVYILAGKLICGICGATLVGQSGGKDRQTGAPYNYYKCGTADRKGGCDLKKIRAEKIENAVIEQIAETWNIDVEKAADEIIALLGSVGEPEELTALKRELSAVKRGFDNVLKAVQAGIINDGLKQENDRLLAEEKRIKTAIANFDARTPTREDVVSFLRGLADIKSKTPDEQKAIIRRIIDKIVVYGDGTPPVIRCRVPLSNSGDAGYLHQSYAYFSQKLRI